MVIRNVYEPTINVGFQLDEALQLERTLMAFMPLLLEDGLMFGKYCVALGICSRYVNCFIVQSFFAHRGFTDAGL